MSPNESIGEDAAIERFCEQDCTFRQGQLVGPRKRAAERSWTEAVLSGVNWFDEMVMVGSLREAIRRLPLTIPFHAIATMRNTLLPNSLSGEGSDPIPEEMVASS
jgi:hypothetical protein